MILASQHTPHPVPTPRRVELALAGDNFYVMEGIRSSLARWGYPVLDRFGSVSETREGLCHSHAEAFLFCFTDGEAGLNLFRTLRRICDPRPVILLMQPGDKNAILEAVRLNADGVGSTEAPPATLLQCVEAVADGRNWVDPSLLRHALLTKTDATASALAGRGSRDAADELTPRQKEILELARLGLSDGQIGDKLNIARKTVAMHLSRICQRLCLADRRALRAYRTSAERFADTLSRTSSLSEREQDVLKLVLEGRRTSEIGSLLGVSEGTIRSFVRRIHIKTGTAGRSELVGIYSAAVAGEAARDDSQDQVHRSSASRGGQAASAAHAQ